MSTLFFRFLKFATALLALCVGACHQQVNTSNHAATFNQEMVQLGPRPFYLIADMKDSPLKSKLASCTNNSFKPSNFSIGHRGAPLQFPEHTRESYVAAAKMGAGILECDVTFTRDKQLVCRHAQCDLHTTTNILSTPLAAKCSEPFRAADLDTGTAASARCCTSDITLQEFKSLQGKMDGFNPHAKTAEEYLQGTASWRTDLYARKGTLLSHAESIHLFKTLGAKFTPELKEAETSMPFAETYTQKHYAQQMIDEYRAAGIDPSDVWTQSFDIDDIRYWIAHTPEFGKQAVLLVGANSPAELQTDAELMDYAQEGIRIIAPPIWALLALDHDNKIIPSQYARAIKAAGLDIITWSLERSGSLGNGGGWYFQTISPALANEGDVMEVLHVLAHDVGVLGVFSDWPATVTYYANCMEL